MIPSLAAGELRSAITEYLATTFAIGDDETRRALNDFLEHDREGLFRGPFLRLRMPFRRGPESWRPSLGWLPEGFRPYLHQAQAFERLSTLDGEPQPTVVVTGTGSGKTEAFLYPILDHCRRQVGAAGVKALLLYPMNALAFDQAGRLARLLHDHEELAGVTAGLYVGGPGSRERPSRDALVDHRRALRADPPDILLTNYRMLDFLLLRDEDQPLWAANDPDTLRYVVLDEFHTYDGAQGTDVAMLLRRLGARLGMAEDGRPLGRATPVGTSATLGAQGSGDPAMRDFAGRVFGVAFDEAAVIGELRETIEEAAGRVDYTLPIPDVDEILALDRDDRAGLARLLTGRDEALGPVELGAALLPHPLTSAVLRAMAADSTERRRALDVVVSHAPNWGAAAQDDPDRVEDALARFLSLLSLARRHDPARPEGAPLFVLEVQLWVREMTRLLREVDSTAKFRWLDGGLAADANEEPAPALPAIYCRQCGRTGWLSVVAELDEVLADAPSTIYRASVHGSPQQRALIKADSNEAGVLHLHPARRGLLPDPEEGTVPVLATPDEQAARRGQCPSCGEDDGIRFLGARVATLASVAITTFFGSSLVADDERKLLAFTDSVQDASHRAAFFAARTYRFNLRTTVARAVTEVGRLSLAALGERVLEVAEADGEARQARHALTPSDLLRDPRVQTLWTATPDARARELLRRRLAFEAHLELGLRTRLGRTLELTGTAVAAADPGDLDRLAALVAEAHEHLAGQQQLPAAERSYAIYVRGLLERLRLRGAILHPWLERYVGDNGRTWHIWGGRPEGMPAFPKGHGRPTFATTGPGPNFDPLTQRGATPTWLADWGARTLGLDAAEAAALNERVFALLAGEGVLAERRATAGHRVYGLDPARVVVCDVPDDGGGRPVVHALRCRLCTHLLPAPPELLEVWSGAPCLRYRCLGRYEPAPVETSNYYRGLYRSGRMRRVVTGEHTGLLDRPEREALEEAFKTGGAADAPNVLACTPTLELGIDIGDLSAVMLTSVPATPASYIQRVGRAGRASGNALAVTFAPADAHSLYYLAAPEHMLAGEIRPPSCYLDAEEILARQYLAYLLDRAADGAIAAPPMPRQIGMVAASGLDEGGWLRAVLDANRLDGDRHGEAFLALFGDHVAEGTRERLRGIAGDALERAVKEAFEAWQHRFDELRRRRDRLKARIDVLEAYDRRQDDDERELRRLRGERAVTAAMIRATRQEYTPAALTRMGLLPNYALLDDAVTLEANLWTERDGEYDTERKVYQRSAAVALTELAPSNSFYVGGHRLVIDALEIGATSEPLYETWRLCPECDYGAPEDDRPEWRACPRCSSPAIADAGARHTLLRLRQVSCTDSEEAARVYDDHDDRDRVHYHTVRSVDVDPVDVEHAWRHDHAVFGVELVSTATIRSLNLGPVERPGEELAIAGATRKAPRFKTCRWCGGVEGARDREGARSRTPHRGWCLTRAGARSEQWDTPILYHELRTEAVRMLMPLSTFEVTERLATFKAVLLLGLRLDFGGDPQHLRVLTADAPGSASGPGRRRFLVLHDTIPGGTGYLGRLADPDRLRRLLDRARTAVARCPCRDEGRAACHRCLLGVADADEVELVTRQLALELLDELLADWTLTPVPTIADLAIGGVEESELERKFRAALAKWADADDDVTLTTRPGGGARADLELRISIPDGSVRRYLVREQAPVTDAHPATTPDFLVIRQDAASPDVAVYLDGYAYHAEGPGNRLADDAAKREGVRATGRLVYSLTWDDVQDFEAAVQARVAKQPADRPLLPQGARRVAEQVLHRTGGGLDSGVADYNPMRQLVTYLTRPDAAAWDRLARSFAAGLAAAGDDAQLNGSQVRDWLRAVAAGETPAGGSGGDVHAWRWSTGHGLPVGVLLDAGKSGGANAQRWTAVTVLDDRPEATNETVHHSRWRDWLQLGNILQHLGTDPALAPAQARCWTVSQAAAIDVDDLDVVPARATVEAAEPAEAYAPTPAPLDAAVAEELALAVDDARPLLEAAVRLGAPAPVVGHELDDPDARGWEIEAAWPAHRVAVVVDHDPDRDAWLDKRGWHTRPAQVWTPEQLLAAIEERS